MVLVAPGDDFSRRCDAALQGITNCVKVVDDVSIYDELLPHLQRVNNVLPHCRAHGIILNVEKFPLTRPAVKFRRFMLSTDGIAADHFKVRASQNSPHQLISPTYDPSWGW